MLWLRTKLAGSLKVEGSRSNFVIVENCTIVSEDIVKSGAVISKDNTGYDVISPNFVGDLNLKDKN